ncbi:hypothetical protein, partial [Salmonella enterica]|uniref:hypothetical protein n=1 Tax=Salmonella enterica TaxID=28901 RepID=UPI0020C30FFC
MEDQIGHHSERKLVVSSDEEQEDNPLKILADVAQKTPVSPPVATELSKTKEPIRFTRKRRRQYLNKESTEASKEPNV